MTRGRAELREIEIMIQNLAGVIEHTASGLCHNLFQKQGLILRAGDEFVEVVHIGLEVLAVVEGQGLRGDDGLEGVDGIREVDQVEHGMVDSLNVVKCQMLVLIIQIYE